MKSTDMLAQLAAEASALARESAALAARRERILVATSEASAHLVGGQIDADSVHGALGILGRATEVSRVYVFRLHPGPKGEVLATQDFEWCAPGVAPQIDNPVLKGLPLIEAGYSRWYNVLTEGRCIAGPLESFPPEEQPALLEQGIKSLVVMPVPTHAGLWGFIGFDDCEKPQAWPDDVVSCLQVIGRVMGASVERGEYRRHNERLLQEYSEVLSAMQDVVFRLDSTGRILYLSPGWTRMTGIKTEEMIGRDCFETMNAEIAAQVRPEIERLASGESTSARIEMPLAAKPGIWVQVGVTRVTGQDGRVRHLVGTMTDITPMKTAQIELVAARQQAEAASRAKSEFLATMSHELRTPLNAVIGLSESMMESLPQVDPERARRYLSIIHQSGRQLLAQINDVIDLARIDTGKIEAALELTDLARIASDVADGLRKEAQAKGVELMVTPSAGPVSVKGDERLLRQVFRNLVGNAIKFTEAGGRVIVTASSDGTHGRVAVSDTGIGIPAEKLNQLFQPFTQIDSSLARRHNGTGLGLALVDRIVRLHQGEVKVESAVGRGSTFTLVLELASMRRPSNTPWGVRPKHVLVIDDDPRQEAVVGDFLRDHGYTVEVFQEPVPALRRVEEQAPGVLVVDMNLGTTSGLDVISAVRSRPRGATIPILALTASAPPEDAAKCRAAGANDYLSKPVELSTLLNRIASLGGHSA